MLTSCVCVCALLLPTCVSIPNFAVWLNDLSSYFKIFMHFMTMSMCIGVYLQHRHKSAPLRFHIPKEISLKQDNLSAGAGTDTTTLRRC